MEAPLSRLKCSVTPLFYVLRALQYLLLRHEKSNFAYYLGAKCSDKSFKVLVANCTRVCWTSLLTVAETFFQPIGLEGMI